MVRRIVGNAADADDIVQEASLYFWMNAGCLDSYQNPGARLTFIAQLRARQFIARRRRDSFQHAPIAWQNVRSACIDPAEISASTDFRRFIRDLLPSLSDTERDAVILSAAESSIGGCCDDLDKAIRDCLKHSHATVGQSLKFVQLRLQTAL